MAESNLHSEQEAQKRRSTRIVQAVPLTVTGVDALGRPFQERTSTLIINCHGARYQSKHYVLKNMWVTLEVPHNEPGHEARSVRGRVTWIQRPRTVRELFQIGVELEVSGNVWGIAFPPGDWFPFPDTAAAPNMEIPRPVREFKPSTRARRLVHDRSRTPTARYQGLKLWKTRKTTCACFLCLPLVMHPYRPHGKWRAWSPRPSSRFRARRVKARTRR